MCDDDVVEGCVLFAEAGEADSEDHCVVCGGGWFVAIGDSRCWSCWRYLFGLAGDLPGAKWAREEGVILDLS